MKVFGIGFPRTGTSSLAAALNMLGINTRQFPYELFSDINHDLIWEFDGFTDEPIPLIYKSLDAQHPSAKFIHTVREEREWLSSVQWLYTTGKVKFKESFERYGNQFSEEQFGTAAFDESKFLNAYREHNQEVERYFAERPDDYLHIDLTRGEGFEKICPFLGVSLPKESFPHRNQRESMWKIRGGRLLWTARQRARNLLFGRHR